MRYVEEDSGRISGWFYPADMLAFWMTGMAQAQAGVPGGLCEVGVYEGKSLVLLSLLAREGEAVTGFDLFPDGMADVARDNVGRYGAAGALRLHAADTSRLTPADLAGPLAGGVRFLHIDAGHEYHEVLHQLYLFSPFVTQGGCIAMDDYQDREFPGIEAAVLDFCEVDRPRRSVPFFAGGNKMYLCERHAAAWYQRSFLQHEAVAGKSRLSRLRDFNVLVGFSKVPMAAEACLSEIAQWEFPFCYDLPLGALARDAVRYGEHRD